MTQVTPVQTDANFAEIKRYVQQILTFATPLVQVVVPGGDLAKRISSIMTAVSRYFEFGEATFEELAGFAKELRAIRADIEADIAAGKDTVDAAQWNEVKADLDAGVARIEALLAERGL